MPMIMGCHWNCSQSVVRSKKLVKKLTAWLLSLFDSMICLSGSATPTMCLNCPFMMRNDAPVMYPTNTLRETNWRRSAILKRAPMTEMMPTRNTRRGM